MHPETKFECIPFKANEHKDPIQNAELNLDCVVRALTHRGHYSKVITNYETSLTYNAAETEYTVGYLQQFTHPHPVLYDIHKAGV